MNGPPERRPPLATSVSAPCIFSRPMDPAPAPLVYINGWHGIGKETVAECLTLLLGRDKSLLIDVRSVGCETATTTSCCGSNGASHNPNNNHHHQHQHTHRHDPNRQYDHRPLLTPEHPRYFSFDADPDDQDPDMEDPDDPNLDTPDTITTTTAITTNPASNPSTTTTSRSASFSSASTTITAATTSSISSASPSTTPSPLLPLLIPQPQLQPHQPQPQLQPQPHPEPEPEPVQPVQPNPDPSLPTPCSSENLTALLSHPPNRSRIAILPACAPDTPAGRAAVRTFEAAAARAGRVFVAVALACEPVEHARRVEEGRIKGFSLLRGGAGGLGLGLRGRRRGRGLSESFATLAVGGGGGAGGGSRRGSVDGGGGGGAGGGDTDGVEGRLRGLSLPVPLRPAIIPEVDEDGVVGAGAGAGAGAAAAGDGMGMGVGWADGLAAPVKAGLTVDVTRVPVFEAALQIVEFVRAREAERDAELCCRGAAKTAAAGLAGEGRRASHAA